MNLLLWKQRPQEEANLFNPAFCSLILFQFVKEYEKTSKKSTPYALLFCVLPIALHRNTRVLLPKTTMMSLYSWRERNPRVLIGFAERAASLRLIAQEAIRFAIDRKALSFSDNGEIAVGDKPLSIGKKFEDTLSVDAHECLLSARLLGRWFAKAGTVSTIMAIWGIKP